jgi:hypothetical protein
MVRVITMHHSRGATVFESHLERGGDGRKFAKKKSSNEDSSNVISFDTPNPKRGRPKKAKKK